MKLQEILRFADDVVFSKTGKHLDDLQQAILRETFQGQKYAKIAQDRNCSEGYVRGVGCELWKILSDVLGEEVSKVNVIGILERAKFYNSYSSAIEKNYGTVNNVNICPEKTRSHSPTPQPQETTNQPHIDLGDAPEIFRFYDRTSELTTLETWILQNSCRLIALLGINGIGKTTLSLRLIEQVKTNFDYIIYRSLRFSPTLNTTLTNLLQIFSENTDIPQNIEAQISQLLNYLRQHRCLIILDDVQMLFRGGQLAGQYKTGSEDYQVFFRLIAEVNHNSCFLLHSWEKPREIAKLEVGNNYVQTLFLGSLGLAAKAILKEHKLLNEESWESLIHIYQGNPLWLELTASTIQELFGGSVSAFLQCDVPILDESLQLHLDRQFQRLTQQEIAVMIQLVKESQPIALPDILKIVELSVSDLVNVMRSLRLRLLLEVQEESNTTYFSLNTVLKKYVKNRYFQS